MSAATELPVAGGMAGQFGAILRNVSCTDGSDCTAVGEAPNYPNTGTVNDELDPAVATERDGVWGPAAKLSSPNGMFYGVSCADANDCTGVGYQQLVIGTNGYFSPIYATMTDGTWGPVTTIPEPPGASAALLAISCWDALDCTAVGQDGSEPLYVTETAGTWGSFQTLAMAGNLESVVCSDAGDCAAVGFEAGNLDQPIAISETGGVWGPVTLISAANGGVLTSVSCPEAGDCTGVGYTTTGVVEPVYAVESGGNWSAATELPTSGGGEFNGVSCTDDEDCTAVGIGSDSQPTNTNTGQAITATESSGTWNTPADIPGATDNSSLDGVDCASVVCTAVGANADSPAVYSPTFATTGPVSHIAILPSALPSSPGAVNYTVTVTGASPAPTGTVSLSDGAGGTCSITLVGGTGSCPMTESAPAGPYTVTASYPGDGSDASATGTLVVTGSVSSGGSASVAGAGVTASAGPGGTDGTDTVTFAPFASDPVGALTGGSNYFDVALSGGATFGAVTLNDCAAGVTAATQLEWWNPAAGGGSGAWQPVMSPASATTPPYGQTAGPPCLSVALNNASAPSLSQLSGIVFGLTQRGGTVTLAHVTGLYGNYVDHFSGTGWSADTNVSLYECTTFNLSAHCTAALDSVAPLTTPGNVGNLPANQHVTLLSGAIDGGGDTCGLQGSPQCYMVAVGNSGDAAVVALGFVTPNVALSRSLNVLGNYVDTVTGHDFPSGDTVHAAQCDSAATPLNLGSACDTTTMLTGTVGANGTVTFSPTGIPMRVGTAYSDPSGGSCSTGGDCSVVTTDVTNPTVTPVFSAMEFIATSVTVYRTTNVLGNYTDAITAHNFPIGDTVDAVECDASVTPLNAPAHCDAATQVSGTAGSNGTVTFSPTGVTLRVGSAYSDLAGQTCSAGASCEVMVTDASNAGVPSSTVSVGFATPTATLAKTTNVLGNYLNAVTAHDFPIGDTVDAVECDNLVSQVNLATNCDAATAVTGTVASTGTVAFSPAGVTMRVGSSYTDPASQPCSTGSTCEVEVTDASNAAFGPFFISVGFATPTVTTAPATVPYGTGHTITITAHNFPIGDTVDAVECDPYLGTGSTSTNCDAATQITGTVASTGTVTWSPAALTVRTSATSPAYADSAGLSCVPGGPACYVAVSDVSNTDPLLFFTRPFTPHP